MEIGENSPDSGDLNDPQNFTRDVANVGQWGNGEYELQIRDDEQIDYTMELAKQAGRKIRNRSNS